MKDYIVPKINNQTHARIQGFLPGGFRPNCQKTALTTFFLLVLNLFYRRCPMVISKKTIIFQGFIGGPTFSGGGSIFFKGESNANFYRNPYLYIKTCDFPGGGGGFGPLIPL